MEGSSGALNSLGGAGRDGEGDRDADGVRDRGLEADDGRREQFSNWRRRPSSSASPTSASMYGPLLSAMLLSLLPLPAAAYPRSETRIIRRDRRRSGGAAERPISKAIVERATRDEGWENKRREHAVERNGEAMISVFAQNSQQPSDPTLTTFQRRVDPAASSSRTTSFPIEVPVTVLPYKLTKGSDGEWTTVDGGWTLYGRTSVNATHHALADTDSSQNRTFNITASLPYGWGNDSERGALYAVPLIVVASVCLALLFMAFVVVVVISRVKARRKAERAKRRREAREKRERREKRAAARAAAAVMEDENNRLSSASVRTHGSRRGREEQRSDHSHSVSTVSDSSDANDEAGSSRRPSGSGTTSTTVRLAKQRAAAVAAAEALEAVPRAGRAKKRFGWTSGVNTAMGIGTARLGDPRRVWGWKKGLRRRNVGAADERDREVEHETTEQVNAEVVLSPVVDDQPEFSPASPVSNVENPHVLGESSSDEPSTEDVSVDRISPAPVSAFPPAYYRTTSGTALPSTSAAPSSDELPAGRVTDVGPSARALEKRPMAGVGYDDCFPAPTTEEQEEAVNIAYNRNIAVAPGESAATTSVGERSATIAPVAAGTAGHVATDDKQVLERLRLAGSAPPPLGDAADSTDAARLPEISEVGQGTAPTLPVDEDGFETLEDLLPPEEAGSSSGTLDGGGQGTVLPLPPAPVAQRSLAYAQPSAPAGMSSPLIASAPSAPYDDEPEETSAMPSAPPLDLDDNSEPDVNLPEPVAPPLSPDERQEGTSEAPGSLTRRFTVPHRTLGIDLPSDLAAPPAFPHTDDSAASTSGVASSSTAIGASRYLPRYEP
ncbi:hypothetical protein NliqN6_5541 [Naganishia liquefaciens]|uniref:Transmembrane protein n=1 Tax=Naganishia liquefaciens TaxID=104408 RepID=A0A8H3YGU6_9TREE|nr:hypothetical protein NliqN6_5541 [Naganishia liquefaciens]